MNARVDQYISPRSFPANGEGIRITAQDVGVSLPMLSQLGIDIREQHARMILNGMRQASQTSGMGMDSLTSTVTQGSIGTPIQFLQNWLPGFVYVLTAARKIDDLIGMMVTGSWEDQEVVQGIMELTGLAQPYGDQTNVPYSSWNANFVRRTVVRGEEGMQVGVLEEARAARMRVNSAEGKREAATLALEIYRNLIGFSGYNSGNNLTYGFLNDPGLSAYSSLPNGGWDTATFLEIQQDVLTAIAALRNSTGDQIDPKQTPITLAISTNRVDFLSTTSDFGISVQDWMKSNYPNIRVVSAPQLNSANSNQNVFYLYAEQVNDSSSDGGRVWVQPVPAKFRLNGVQPLAKGYQESYSNATAGAMCKRPYAVVRYTNI